MTTSRPAREATTTEITDAEVVGALVPAPTGAPDRETLSRVLDRLRDLPRRPGAHAAPASAAAPEPTTAVPLPRRRRDERGAPSVD